MKVRFDLENLPLVKEETKATYQEIKDYIYNKYNVKVSILNIAQTKTKYGSIKKECYNKPKDDDSHQLKGTREKEEMIVDALKHLKCYNLINLQSSSEFCFLFCFNLFSKKLYKIFITIPN